MKSFQRDLKSLITTRKIFAIFFFFAFKLVSLQAAQLSLSLRIYQECYTSVRDLS